MAEEGIEGTELAELLTSPLGNVRGRKAATCEFTLLGTLGEEDLAELSTPVNRPQPHIIELRDRHHSIARLLALGYPSVQVAAITGMSQNRITILQDSPAFQELLAHYRSEGGKEFRDLRERFAQLGLEASEELLARLADSPEEIPLGELREILKLSADRTGHGPTTKNINLNGTIDGEMLERLRHATQNQEKIIHISETSTKSELGHNGGGGSLDEEEASGKCSAGDDL